MIAGTEALDYALTVLVITWVVLTALSWAALVAVRSHRKHLDVQRRELLRSIMENE